MAKIDETVMRETRYVIKVIIILSVIMEAVFLIVGIWNYKVLIGNIFGGTIAAVNFLLMTEAITSSICLKIFFKSFYSCHRHVSGTADQALYNPSSLYTMIQT